MKLWKGNVLQASVILSMTSHVSPPTVLLASGWYASFWNTVLFKLGLNCETMGSSWVFMGSSFSELFYFYLRERCRKREMKGGGVGKFNSFL